MSDVVGNDLSDIASAPTYFDKTTFKDEYEILTKYNLKNISQRILQRLDDGIHGKIPETPKFPKIKNYIIATNNDCLDAMLAKAQKLGYVTKSVQSISGNVKVV